MAEQYEESKLYRLRHSAAHVMAQAVLEKFPEGKVAIGPPVEDGFYYDFDLPRALTPEDLEEIEARMREIIKNDSPFIREEVTAEEAVAIFKDQPYKLELIEGLEAGDVDEHGNPVDEKPAITIYKSDEFVDLCRGPHLESTGKIHPSAVKLMSVAGAYWRGDEHNPMLQRIYGTAWLSPKELKQYLWRLEEARKRDHRRLGRDLDLYSVSDEVGSGLVLWHPNGAMIRFLAERFWEDEHLNNGYDFVYTPHIGKAQLWKTSGHLDFYAENMYAPIEIEENQYYLKPMNCPFHVQIYKSDIRSYRDLPMRFAEKGTVYRYERSGVMHGLMRVRGFTQDDAHHFCAPSQMPEEIDFVLSFSLHILRSFGFEEISAYLSTMPEKAVGEPERWRDAEAALEASLKRAELPYELDEGGGAFYGPKIDLKIKDALGREWQLSTIQFDFNLPERFDMNFVDEDGGLYRPYMIHRALMGSIERFFGILIEHYAGAFPTWLAPVQAVIIPIADRHVDYARAAAGDLEKAGLRVQVDARSDRMNAKIRDAEKQKVPFMLVVGDREMDNGEVDVRRRSGDRLGSMNVEAFKDLALKDVKEKVKG